MKMTVYVANANAAFDTVPSLRYKGELTLGCPNCKSRNITMQGKNLRGEGVNKTFCNDCGFTAVELETLQEEDPNSLRGQLLRQMGGGR